MHATAPAEKIRTEAALVTVNEFAALLHLGRTQFHTWRAAGRVGPQPLSTIGRPKWDSAEVRAWLAARDAAGQLYDAAGWAAVRRLANPGRQGGRA